MHMRKNPSDMHEDPYYEDVVEEVIEELRESIEIAKMESKELKELFEGYL